MTKADGRNILSFMLFSIIISYNKIFMGNNFGNFLIFAHSFKHLLLHQNLYADYSFSEHLDYFKYSPTFALLMGIFSWLPIKYAALVWSAVKGACFYLAINEFLNTFWSQKRLNILTLIMFLVVMITPIQNFQTNLLIIALLLLFISNLYKNKTFFAATFLLFSVFIKPYCLFFLIFLTFFPRRSLKFYLYFFIVAILLLLLPMTIGPFGYLKNLYINWYWLIRHDVGLSYGLSIMGFLYKIFHINQSLKTMIAILGCLVVVVITCCSAFIARQDRDIFTMLLLKNFVLILLSIVIFNPKAESPTFVIAYVGGIIWFITLKKYTGTNIIIFIYVWLFGILLPTELYSEKLRIEIFIPYAIQATTVFVLWIKVIIEIIKSWIIIVRGKYPLLV